MDFLGDYAEDATVNVYFTTNDGSGGAVAPSTAFEAADVAIYKDGSATQKATTNGVTMTSPFDAVTGLHLVVIDTSNDTGDAGFWVTGSDYTVVLNPDETVDSQSIVHVLAQFSIENRYERGTDSAFLAANAPTNFADLSITATTGRVDVASVEGSDATDQIRDAILDDATRFSGADIATILTDTAELQGDWTNGGRLDLIIDSILADTGELQSDDIPGEILKTRDLIESQRDDHSQVGKGNIYYVDPVNGDTHANGNRGGRTDPYAGIQDCHDNAVTDYNHDTIILVAGSGVGQTSLDEQVTISKNYVFLRGPGLGFKLTTSTTGDLLTISGDGVEVSSIELATHTVGSGAAVVVTGNFVQVRHVTISRSQGDGIQVTDCEKALIENVRMFNTGQGGSGDGIAVDGTNTSTRFTLIRHCELLDTQGDGINLAGANVDDTIISDNAIHGSTGWGVNIGNGVTATVVHDNFFSNNSSGSVTDAGTNSDVERNEQWAKHTIATEARLAELDAANIPSDVDAILTDTNELQSDDVPGLIAALNDLSAAEVNAEVDSAFTTQMADSVPSDGTIATREQALYMILQFLTDFGISGTTLTVRKVDGSTALMTFTLDDGTNPTSLTRAT